MHADQARKGRSLGFTLVELIVAMVILATLAAIAIPSYSSYVLKSHRTEVKAALLDAASLEERYFSTSNTYTIDPTKLGYGVAAPPITVGNGQYYWIQSIAVTAAAQPTALSPGGTPATYLITAVPNPGSMQISDTACWQWTVNSAGQQTAATQGGADNTAACWQN